LSEIEAFKLRHPEIFGQDGGEDDGDDVSSRWQGSDAGSEEGGAGEDEIESKDTGDQQ
jgi:hypothetical protein